jgi:hypothetical protein
VVLGRTGCLIARELVVALLDDLLVDLVARIRMGINGLRQISYLEDEVKYVDDVNEADLIVIVVENRK